IDVNRLRLAGIRIPQLGTSDLLERDRNAPLVLLRDVGQEVDVERVLDAVQVEHVVFADRNVRRGGLVKGLAESLTSYTVPRCLLFEELVDGDRGVFAAVFPDEGLELLTGASALFEQQVGADPSGVESGVL